MPYVLSKLSNSQVYTKYIKGANGINQAVKSILIKGGADITDKNLITPQGVITEVSSEDLEVLKENKVFQQHLENRMVEYFGIKPNIEKKTEKMSKDKSKQLTKKDFEEQGIKAPETGEQ